MTIRLDPELLTGFVFALVRASAWVLVAPPFSSRVIPMRVKFVIAVALALAAAPHVGGPAPLDTPGFVLALFTQAVVGLALGFVTMVLFSALQAAGALIDDFSGFNLASLLDPLTNNTVSVFGRFYQVVATMLLFALNLHLMLTKGFVDSFSAVRGLRLGDLARLLTTSLDTFMVAAMEVAGPVLAVLFLTEISFGLLARAAPQMNVFVLAFPVRVLVSLLVVAIALPLMVPALGNLVRDAIRGGFGL